MFIFEFIGGLFAFRFVRYTIVFLLGCFLGATGMHSLLVGMWHELEVILPFLNAFNRIH